MIVRTVKFAVSGQPLPQGSKVVKRRGRVNVLVDQSDIKTKTRPSNALKKWRARIADQAAAVYKAEPWAGPVVLSAEFVLPLPRSYLTTRGALRRGKPTTPMLKPDLDKLLRAIKDACTKILYHDDAQVIAYRPPMRKRWARPGGVGGCILEFDLLDGGSLTPNWEPVLPGVIS